MNKEQAEKYRETAAALLKEAERLEAIDSYRPEPGTVVWWRDCPEMPWRPGLTSQAGIFHLNKAGYLWDEDWNMIEYKPARILAPDEVAVTKDNIRTALDTLTAALQEVDDD